jgi:hypothetical protein
MDEMLDDRLEKLIHMLGDQLETPIGSRLSDLNSPSMARQGAGLFSAGWRGRVNGRVKHHQLIDVLKKRQR